MLLIYIYVHSCNSHARMQCVIHIQKKYVMSARHTSTFFYTCMKPRLHEQNVNKKDCNESESLLPKLLNNYKKKMLTDIFIDMTLFA